MPDRAVQLLCQLVGGVVTEQVAEATESWVLLEFVSAVYDLCVRVRDVLDFGGLVAGEAERGNHRNKLESPFLRDDHVSPFLNLAGLGLFGGLDRLGAAVGVAESSAGSIAGGLVF